MACSGNVEGALRWSFGLCTSLTVGTPEQAALLRRVASALTHYAAEHPEIYSGVGKDSRRVAASIAVKVVHLLGRCVAHCAKDDLPGVMRMFRSAMFALDAHKLCDSGEYDALFGEGQKEQASQEEADRKMFPNLPSVAELRHQGKTSRRRMMRMDMSMGRRYLTTVSRRRA